jgi:probable O-glycosylation ligase (exosortase A-associated)
VGKGILLTYVLTFGGGAASLVRPYIGLLVYISFSIVKPEVLWLWYNPLGNTSRIVGFLFLAGWILNGCGTWKFGRARPIVTVLVAYWVWMLLSGFWASTVLKATQLTNLGGVEETIENLSKIVLPFVAGMTLIDSLEKTKQLAWVMLLSQGYLAFELNLSLYQGTNRLQDDLFVGMDNNCVAIAMVTGTGLGFFLGLYSRNWWSKALAFVLTAAMAHAVLFSFSRGGMLALIIVGIVSFLLIPKKLTHYAIFALAVMLCLRLAGTEVRERFMTAFVETEQLDDSARGRTYLWKDCWDVMLKNPIFGIGPEQWLWVGGPAHNWPYGKAAHSVWFQTGAELGFPGLLCLLAFYGSCLISMWPLTRERENARNPWITHSARLVCASLIGFMVAAQFVSLMNFELPYYIVLLGASVLKLESDSNAASATPGLPSAPTKSPSS